MERHKFSRRRPGHEEADGPADGWRDSSSGGRRRRTVGTDRRRGNRDGQRRGQRGRVGQLRRERRHGRLWAYDPLVVNDTANLDVDGSFTLQCTKGTPATLSLSNGTNFSGGRRMASGANFLTYDLYTTAGRRTVWNAPIPWRIPPPARLCSRSPSTAVSRVVRTHGWPYTDTVVATVTSNILTLETTWEPPRGWGRPGRTRSARRVT